MLADQGGDVPEVHACLRVMLLCLVLPHRVTGCTSLYCDPELMQALIISACIALSRLSNVAAGLLT